MTTAAVIVAAGRGRRAGGGLPKQWRDLGGKPVLAHAVAAFRDGGVGRIVVVVHPDDMGRAAALGDVETIPGGVSRDSSVRNALEALDGAGVTRVLIHDGARPLVTGALIAAVLAPLEAGASGAAPALPVAEALWRGRGGRVRRSVPREGLHRAQTPQAFRFDAILRAHRGHVGGAADDVEVALAAGLDVAIVEGDEDNIKLTWPADFARAAGILRARASGETAMDIRTGTGFDVHRFTEGDAVVLCGVRIPHDRALAGHSDADVAIHALCDAIYGALAEGDIGVHFPPSDPQWAGTASHVFLDHACARAAGRGLRIGHADVTLICERPKIGPHATEMRAELARIMGVEPGRVNVKATTSEGLGFTGRGEGIAAMAAATLVPA